MVMLAPNVPHSGADPRIVVENKLEPGKYRFRLVVLDEAKNASLPADIVVEVRPRAFRPIDPEILTRPDIFVRPDVITQPAGPVIRPDVIKPAGPVINPEIITRPIKPDVIQPAGPALNPEIVTRPINPAINPGIIRPFKPRNPTG